MLSLGIYVNVFIATEWRIRWEWDKHKRQRKERSTMGREGREKKICFLCFSFCFRFPFSAALSFSSPFFPSQSQSPMTLSQLEMKKGSSSDLSEEPLTIQRYESESQYCLPLWRGEKTETADEIDSFLLCQWTRWTRLLTLFTRLITHHDLVCPCKLLMGYRHKHFICKTTMVAFYFYVQTYHLTFLLSGYDSSQKLLAFMLCGQMQKASLWSLLF